MKELDKYMQEAINNIRNDRALTNKLLVDVMTYLAKEESGHESVGTVAAKYLETLQRSNEQLVKVVALLHKKTNASETLTKEDKEELFELIKETG
jgi:hypothetical protein